MLVLLVNLLSALSENMIGKTYSHVTPKDKVRCAILSMLGHSYGVALTIPFQKSRSRCKQMPISESQQSQYRGVVTLVSLDSLTAL